VAVCVAAVCVAASADAQRVTLEVRPRPGDTLRVTLDHAVTISGGPRNFPDSATTYTTTYHVSTRDIVERADEKGAVILAIVDSIRMRTTGSIGASPFPGVDRSMQHLRVRLRVMADGSSQIIEGITQLDPELRDVFGSMPSVLPLVAVRPGDTWTRALPLPAEGGPVNAPSSGTLRASFRLDSLSDSGDRAWISLTGQLVPGRPAESGSGAPVTRMTGTLSGTLVLDRRRGWLDRSEAIVEIESLVETPGAAVPLLVRVRVVQRMQTAVRKH
jgi:hypothetical protein